VSGPKTVWVTGASGGIGAELARAYAARGDRVAISARRADKLNSLAAELGGAALPVALDVTDREAVLAAASQISEELGEIDVAIMNAAFWQQVMVDSWDSSLVRRHFDTNVMGMVHGIEAVLPSMRRRGRGTIVGMASLAGYRGFPRSEGYGPTKAALINMLEALRIDLKPTGIEVITVCPGFVRTELTSHNRFPMPMMLEADDAARRIVHGIDRGKAEIAFPLPIALGIKALRFVPAGPYAWAVARMNQR
jgi:short-subunit dehydrogenase